MSDEAYDPGSEGARMAFADAMSYGDYLKLDRVLSPAASPQRRP